MKENILSALRVQINWRESHVLSGGGRGGGRGEMKANVWSVKNILNVMKADRLTKPSGRPGTGPVRQSLCPLLREGEVGGHA